MRRIPILLIATTVCAVVVAVLVNVATTDWNPVVIGALMLAVAVSLVVEVLRHRQHDEAGTAGSAPDLDAACDRLAHAVQTSWRAESEHRRLHDPRMLQVSWQAEQGDRVDHWSNIRGLPTRVPDAMPIDLRGMPNRLIGPYRRLPHGRLVVLGAAGSGKTILVQQLVLDLLDDRDPGDPVPVIFGIGGWDPAGTPLRAWLVDQLHRDQPGLARPVRDGVTLAAELIARGRILPVLDGFDEIGHGLHRDALRSLNELSTPLVLTSRPREYHDAVDQSRALGKAAVITLDHLDGLDVADYLRMTTHRDRWAPVLDRLDENPALRDVLTNPLMVMLARTIYSDTPDNDPAELLDHGEFGTQHLIENHLLRAYVPAVYRIPTGGGKWDAATAQRWLGRLAGDLAGNGTHDIVWWQLPALVSRPVRGAVVGVTVGVFTWTLMAVTSLNPAFALAVAIALTIGVALAAWLPTGAIGRFVAGFVSGVVMGMLLGVLYSLPIDATIAGSVFCAVALGLAVSLAGGVHPQPARTRIRFRLPGLPFWSRMRTATGFGLLTVVTFLVAAWRDDIEIITLDVGLVFLLGVTVTIAMTMVLDAFDRGKRGSIKIRGGLAGGVLGLSLLFLFPGQRTFAEHVGAAVLLFAYGFVLGLIADWLVSVLRGLEVPIDVATAASPTALLYADRSNAVNQSLVVGVPFAAFISVPATLANGPVAALGLAGVFLAILGIARVAGSAWGRWLVLVRLWFPLTGRLPWRVLTFLDDAHDRGVLRRAGAVYQFRHLRLRDQLAAGQAPSQ